MELGQRLRQVRIEQGLSQRQLCGDVITRNMLSQIENGSARPSMDTLSYLAARLGKPISFFLEENTCYAANAELMQQTRAAYTDQNWQEVLQLLKTYSEADGLFDEERWLLEALALLSLAEEAAQQNRASYARQLLEEAQRAQSRTPYCGQDLERRRMLLLAEILANPATLPEDDRALLLRAEAKLKEKNITACTALLDCCDNRSSARWHRIRGEAAYAAEDYKTAVSHLHVAEDAYPRLCYERLEQCYRVLEDYKMAYEYACKQRTGSAFSGK